MNMNEKAEYIRAHVIAGSSYEEIGKHLGITRQRVQQIAKVCGVRPVPRWQRNTPPTPQERKKRQMYSSAFNRAEKSGIPFDLALDDIKTPERCPVLGIPLNYENDYTKDDSPSLDKTDPALGYVTGNVVVMSFRANTLKSNGTLPEFQCVVKYLQSLKNTC